MTDIRTMGTEMILDAWKRVRAGGPLYRFLVICFGLLTLVGIAAGIHALFIAGSRHAYGTYREVPMALLISAYIFFVVASTGLCLVSSIGHVFGVKDFMPIAKRSIYLSIITILAGFMVIGLEIENPFRMLIYNVISPGLTSNIWWMGTLYGFYLVFMITEFGFLMFQNHRKASAVGLMGVLSGVAAHSNLGGIFAMMQSREFWYGPYLPIYFIPSALMTGCGFIILFVILAHRISGESISQPTRKALAGIGNVAILMVSVVMFFTTWKIIATTVGGPLKLEALSALVNGPYSFNFWVLEIAGGMVIPLVLFLLSKGKNLMMMFIASAIMVFCIFFMRLDLVLAGQIVPLYIELGVVEYAHLLTYTPTLHEILVVLGGVGFFGFAFLLGEKIFAGFSEETTGHESERRAVAGEAEEAS